MKSFESLEKVFECLWKFLKVSEILRKSQKVSESLSKVSESLLMNLTVMHLKRVLSLVQYIDYQFSLFSSFLTEVFRSKFWILSGWPVYLHSKSSPCVHWYSRWLNSQFSSLCLPLMTSANQSDFPLLKHKNRLTNFSIIWFLTYLRVCWFVTIISWFLAFVKGSK